MSAETATNLLDFSSLAGVEIIRQALERELASPPSLPGKSDRSAWEEHISFPETHRRTASSCPSYQWDRAAISTGRANRWLRDQEQD